MGTRDETRVIGVCVECGSMYAALEVANGKILPIGSRRGCTSCGGREFESRSGTFDSPHGSPDEAGRVGGNTG